MAQENVAPPQVRIFPHNRKEFPLEDSLRTWLLSGLRRRDGLYYLVDPNAVKDMSCGSIALFRYADRIVGEAIVSDEEESLSEPVTKLTLSGDQVAYDARITFAPSSIRLYAPPLLVEGIQPFEDQDIMFPSTYHLLKWETYGRILQQQTLSRGGFVS